jgi:hypothetical protein
LINPPSEKTLKKYGLSAGEWLDILELQGGVCAVCKKAPKSGRYHIDHDHVRGWKDLPDEKRNSTSAGFYAFGVITPTSAEQSQSRNPRM